MAALPAPCSSVEGVPNPWQRGKKATPHVQRGPLASADPMASRCCNSGQAAEVDALAKATAEAESHAGTNNRQGAGNVRTFDLFDNL